MPTTTRHSRFWGAFAKNDGRRLTRAGPPRPPTMPPHAAAARSVAAAAVWATISAALILTNKALLSGPFPFPLTLALLHSACAGLVFSVCSGGSGPAAVPLRTAAPVGILFATSLALANAAFAAGLSVSGAQAIKAATSAAVYGLSIAAALDTLTRRRAAAVAAILVGVVIASTGEASVAASSAIGLALQAGAVCAEAGRLVLLQALLTPRVTPIAVLARVAPVSAAALALPWAALEARPLLASFFSAAAAPPPLPLLAASCAVAIALNLAAAHLVQTASALALTVTGVIKDWALVAASALFFGSRLAPATAAGYALACAGVAAYQRDAWLAAAAREGRPPSGEKRELLAARGSDGGEKATA